MKKSSLSGLVMGVVTVLLCILVSYGILTRVSYRPEAFWLRAIPECLGCLVLVAAGVGLLFSGIVRWRQTFLNPPMYAGIYFFLSRIFRDAPNGLFPRAEVLPGVVQCLFIMTLLWGIQSIVLIVVQKCFGKGIHS